MSKKLIDVLKVISSRVNSNALSAAISASAPFEVEFEETDFQEIEKQSKGLVTLDEAANNAEVYKILKPKIESDLDSEFRNKSKAEILHGVETEFAKVGKAIGIDLKDKKWTDSLKEIKTHVLNQSGDVDVRVTQLTQENDRLNKVSAKDKKALSAIEEKHTGQIATLTSTNHLRNEIIKSVPLAKAYQEDLVRDGIIDRLVDTVHAKASVNFDNTTKSIKFMNLDPEHNTLEVMTGDNKKAVLLDLIGTEAQPYIAAAPTDKGAITSPDTITAPKTYTGSAADAMQREKDRLLAEMG